MCGIFGYVGNKDSAAEMTLDALKLMEYRGYDSWGIAVKRNKKLVIEKHIGKIGDAKTILPKSTLGIGHTRWATHGGVTTANAHPHLDCSQTLSLVHNGIIENFQEIKDVLLKKGHTFLSQTDTEVVVHLIEEEMKTKGFATAVRDSFKQLKGFNAFVIADALSKEIIAVKNGSPLVVGFGEDGLYIASDVSGIIDHTRNILFLEDNQMVILGETVKLLQLPSGEEKKPHMQKIDWKFETAEKGTYKHFLIKEVHDQPQVLRNIALNYSSEINKFAKEITTAFGTFFLGCGTASYAALAGTYLFSHVAKKHVNFSVGSEFKYLEDYLTPQTLVVPISQSGETIDVVDPVGNAKKKGAKIIALVNVLGSTLYRLADQKILLNAGVEKSVCATKSFIAMIGVLLLTAYTLKGKQKEGQLLLKKAADDIQNIISEKNVKIITAVAEMLKNKEHIYIIGRGLSYATALEATLKIKEVACVHAEGFAGGELKHGVIALVEKGTPCIVMAPNDETYEEIISNAQEIKARGGFIIGIGPRQNDVFDRFLPTGDIGDGTIMSQVVVSQLLAYQLALKRGIEDPDKPRNLAKSVVVK